jgi:hypothetical protein
MDLLRLASDGSRAEKAKEKAATIQALKPAVGREQAVELFRGAEYSTTQAFECMALSMPQRTSATR